MAASYPLDKKLRQGSPGSNDHSPASSIRGSLRVKPRQGSVSSQRSLTEQSNAGSFETARGSPHSEYRQRSSLDSPLRRATPEPSPRLNGHGNLPRHGHTASEPPAVAFPRMPMRQATPQLRASMDFEVTDELMAEINYAHDLGVNGAAGVAYAGGASTSNLGFYGALPGPSPTSGRYDAPRQADDRAHQVDRQEPPRSAAVYGSGTGHRSFADLHSITRADSPYYYTPLSTPSLLPSFPKPPDTYFGLDGSGPRGGSPQSGHRQTPPVLARAQQQHPHTAGPIRTPDKSLPLQEDDDDDESSPSQTTDSVETDRDVRGVFSPAPVLPQVLRRQQNLMSAVDDGPTAANQHAQAHPQGLTTQPSAPARASVPSPDTIESSSSSDSRQSGTPRSSPLTLIETTPSPPKQAPPALPHPPAQPQHSHVNGNGAHKTNAVNGVHNGVNAVHNGVNGVHNGVNSTHVYAAPSAHAGPATNGAHTGTHAANGTHNSRHKPPARNAPSTEPVHPQQYMHGPPQMHPAYAPHYQTPTPSMSQYDERAGYYDPMAAYYQSMMRPPYPLPPTPQMQPAIPQPLRYPAGPTFPSHMPSPSPALSGSVVLPPYSPVPPVGSPYPFPFGHIRRGQGPYHAEAPPSQSEMGRAYDPGVIREQLARQMQAYALNTAAAPAPSESTLSPRSTPFPGPAYNPWLYLQTSRAYAPPRPSTAAMSIRSSPSHEPLPLPTFPAATRARPPRQRHERARPNVPPRVESTQPRETSPELSSGEETAGPDQYTVDGDNDDYLSGSSTWMAPEDAPGAESNRWPWVDEEPDMDGNDLLDLEFHADYVANPEKRQKRLDARWDTLLRAFSALDRETDTTMLLLAAPPDAPALRLVGSRALRRNPVMMQSAGMGGMRQLFETVATQRASERSQVASLVDRLAQPESEEGLRRALDTALGSLSTLGRMYEEREARWKSEMLKLDQDRERVQMLLAQVLGNSVPHQEATTSAGPL